MFRGKGGKLLDKGGNGSRADVELVQGSRGLRRRAGLQENWRDDHSRKERDKNKSIKCKQEMLESKTETLNNPDGSATRCVATCWWTVSDLKGRRAALTQIKAYRQDLSEKPG